MTPTVGRSVHYVAYGTPGGEYAVGAHRAALITEVFPPQTVNLVVFNPTGLHFVFSRPYDETGQAPGSWHWQEKVD